MMGIWKVTSACASKVDCYYPIRVIGYNAETGATFSWLVPTIEDERYDLSKLSPATVDELKRFSRK